MSPGDPVAITRGARVQFRAVVERIAWGKEWHMTPYRLIGHVQRVGRRTVRPDEIDGIATRGLQCGG